MGDIAIRAQRLEILRDFPLLALNQSVQDLAAQFLTRSNLPLKAKVDAIHIAAATVQGTENYLKRGSREKYARSTIAIESTLLLSRNGDRVFLGTISHDLGVELENILILVFTALI